MIYTSLDSALDALSNGILHICLANQITKNTGGGNHPPLRDACYKKVSGLGGLRSRKNTPSETEFSR